MVYRGNRALHWHCKGRAGDWVVVQVQKVSGVLIRPASEEWSNLNIPVDVRNFNVL